MSDLAGKVKAALQNRKAEGRGFVLVLSSAPRANGAGLKHGVGRSAVADAVASLLDAERLSTGKVFRDMAAEIGLPIEAFHELIPDHPEWDAGLDRRVIRQIEKAKSTGTVLVVDSNLAAILAEPDLALRIDVPDAVRARRVMEGHRYGDRLFESPQEALAFLDDRSSEEAERYLAHPDPLYENVDLHDDGPYKGTIDNAGSLEKTVDAVLKKVLGALESGC